MICFSPPYCEKYLMGYSLVRLVRPNTEELISRPFMGLLKIRWLLQDRMRTWDQSSAGLAWRRVGVVRRATATPPRRQGGGKMQHLKPTPSPVL